MKGRPSCASRPWGRDMQVAELRDESCTTNAVELSGPCSPSLRPGSSDLGLQFTYCGKAVPPARLADAKESAVRTSQTFQPDLPSKLPQRVLLFDLPGQGWSCQRPGWAGWGRLGTGRGGDWFHDTTPRLAGLSDLGCWVRVRSAPAGVWVWCCQWRLSLEGRSRRFVHAPGMIGWSGADWDHCSSTCIRSPLFLSFSCGT